MDMHGETTRERLFWAKVDRGDGSGCWLWTAAKVRHGYGPIPAGLLILHDCDNPPCVRPDHLHPGTQQDNRREAMVRRRVATGERHGSQTHPEALRRGEQHGMAKLTAERVVEIRARYVRYKRGGDTLKALAKEFGVTGVTIARVVKGETWKVV